MRPCAKFIKKIHLLNSTFSYQIICQKTTAQLDLLNWTTEQVCAINLVQRVQTQYHNQHLFQISVLVYFSLDVHSVFPLTKSKKKTINAALRWCQLNDAWKSLGYTIIAWTDNTFYVRYIQSVPAYIGDLHSVEEAWLICTWTAVHRQTEICVANNGHRSLNEHLSKRWTAGWVHLPYKPTVDHRW